MRATRRIEREVNQIRLDIYEKTKDMTPSQLSEYYRQNTEAAVQKYDLKVVASAEENSAL